LHIGESIDDAASGSDVIDVGNIEGHQIADIIGVQKVSAEGNFIAQWYA
jgi:hypothetical protein